MKELLEAGADPNLDCVSFFNSSVMGLCNVGVVCI